MQAPTTSHLEALRPSDREIRVLDLLPGHSTEVIKCDIRIVNLDENPEYEALSYVWGTLPAQEEIEVSGHRIHVTPNLHDALRRLRRLDRVRTVWIDQICINQWDIKEKSKQVSMMRDIYRRCFHCIIWLGEIPYLTHGICQADAAAVFDFIRTVAHTKHKRSPRQPALLRQGSLQDLPTLFQDGPEGEAARRAFAAFAMYGNTWWSRIWTIQESILPKSAELVWGPLSVSREDVMVIARRLRDDSLRSFPVNFQKRRLELTPLLRCLLYPVHGFVHSKKGEEPLDLFMRWRHRQATDPRDKVYALLGLLPPHDIPSAQPCSYFISAPELFARVTLDLIRQDSDLRPFLAASEMLHETRDLPTWAIDFACSNRVGKRQLKWWGHSHRYRQFTACGSQELQLTVRNSGRKLGLTGIFIDKVLRVNDVYTVTADEPIIRDKVLDIITGCEKIVEWYRASREEQIPYPSGDTWSSALWRTMVGDLIMNEFPVERAEDSHEVRFKAVRTRLAPGEPEKPNILLESIHGMVPNHAFFITEAGYMGIGPPNTLPGDQVWVFYGGRVPFVMRDVNMSHADDKNPSLNLVGDAYVHGIMDGQAIGEDHQAQNVSIY